MPIVRSSRVRHRMALLMIGIAMPLLPGCRAGPPGLWQPEIAVRVRVVDPQGQPIPYATAWVTKTPCSPIRTPCLEPEDLRRVVSQFRESFEYFTSWGKALEPYEQINYYGASDSEGVWNDRGDAASKWGAPPPTNQVTVSLAFFKQGYQPAVVDFSLRPTTLLTQEKTVVLAPDPEFPRQESALRRRFEALLQEIYAVQLHKPGLPPGPRRALAQIQKDLETVASQAEAQGDRPLAARAWYRLAYMPSVIDIRSGPTQISGYSSGGDSPDSAALEAKAGLLDPDNPFFIIDTRTRPLFSSNPPDPRHRWDSVAPDRLRTFAQQDGEMLRSMLDRLWPTSAKKGVPAPAACASGSS